MFKRKKKDRSKGQEDAIWSQTAETPVDGVLQIEKQSKKARRLRILVWSTIFLFPVSMLASTVAIGSLLGNQGVVESAETSADEFAETKSKATLAVRDWLSSDPSPLPGGNIVAWESAEVENYEPELDENGDPVSLSASTPYRIETHRFMLSGPEEQGLFHAVVPVAFDEENGAVILSTPSLLPVVPANDSWNPVPFPNHEDAEISEAVMAAVNAWAAAYTSGDPVAIAQVMRDTDESHSYMPLIGARLRDITIEGSWMQKTEDEDVEPLTFIRVTAGLDWVTSPIESGSEAPRISLDLLIEDANTTAPIVVAWGGAGQGPELRKFGNAVTVRKVVSEQTDPDDFTDGTPSVQDPATDPATDPVNEPVANNKGNGKKNKGKKNKKGKNQ